MFIHFHTFSMLWGEIFISADGAGGGMAGLLFLVGFGVCDMITNEKKGRLTRFPNRSATLCGDSQAVKTMKNTAEVCHAAGGAKPPKSWLLHKG